MLSTIGQGHLLKIAECAFGCTEDSHCAKGLLCAAQHEADLLAAGLDQRKAYCGFLTTGDAFSAPCYQPFKTFAAFNRTKELHKGLISICFQMSQKILYSITSMAQWNVGSFQKFEVLTIPLVGLLIKVGLVMSLE